jgi:hypothetical protein
MPEFQLSVPGEFGSKSAIRFTLLYGCSHSDAVDLAHTSRSPVIVVRDGSDTSAAYFIYSWDEDTGQVTMVANEETFVPRQRMSAESEEEGAVRPASLPRTVASRADI